MLRESRFFKRSLFIVTPMAIVFGLLGSSPASVGKPTITTVNVTTIIHDDNLAPNDLLLRSDHFNDSSQASYVTSGCRPSSCDLWSHISGSLGSWQLLLAH